MLPVEILDQISLYLDRKELESLRLAFPNLLNEAHIRLWYNRKAFISKEVEIEQLGYETLSTLVRERYEQLKPFNCSYLTWHIVRALVRGNHLKAIEDYCECLELRPRSDMTHVLALCCIFGRFELFEAIRLRAPLTAMQSKNEKYYIFVPFRLLYEYFLYSDLSDMKRNVNAQLRLVALSRLDDDDKYFMLFNSLTFAKKAKIDVSRGLYQVMLGLSLTSLQFKQKPWVQLIYTAAKELFKLDCFRLNALVLIYMPFHRLGVDMTIVNRLKFAIHVAYAFSARIEAFQHLLVILKKLNESVYHETLLGCSLIRLPHYTSVRYIFNELKLAGKLKDDIVYGMLVKFLTISPHPRDLRGFLAAYGNQKIFNDALSECMYQESLSFDYLERILESASQVNLTVSEKTLRIIVEFGPTSQAERIFRFVAKSGRDIRKVLLEELENFTDITARSARLIVRVCVEHNISFLRSARKVFQTLSTIEVREEEDPDGDEYNRIQEAKEFLATLLME